MVDIGPYHGNIDEYDKLVKELYEQNPPITLPPEIASFVKGDLVRLMIRLARYKFVARLLKRTDRVLEIGAGGGLGAILMGQHCESVTAIDTRSTEIEEAKSINRRDNVKFVHQDLFNMSDDSRFDVVSALDVIEHFPVEGGRTLLSSMVKHLKPDGMLVIGTPSLYSLPYQGALSRASHIKCYDLAELRELVEQYCSRTLPFSMNDELVHTGNPKMAWYYFVLGTNPKSTGAQG